MCPAAGNPSTSGIPNLADLTNKEASRLAGWVEKETAEETWVTMLRF